ncbi:MAG: hypothetical protein COY68_04665 [Candidatus Levybacteria bacterium CG_4_10_14_0_8_um_filter_35_23]|nr:MAG: hypothetical protein COY68_04665 [Candidatus Levybacteria bacterium CG_4_10_14_0_8_um_filter_35_23]
MKEICKFQLPEGIIHISPVNQLLDLRELGIKTSSIEGILLRQCDIPTALSTAIKGSFPQNGIDAPIFDSKKS